MERQAAHFVIIQERLLLCLYVQYTCIECMATVTLITVLKFQFICVHAGYGVFCEDVFRTGHFLLEYRGEVISKREGESRELSYPESKGSFLYFFNHGGSTKW